MSTDRDPGHVSDPGWPHEIESEPRNAVEWWHYIVDMRTGERVDADLSDRSSPSWWMVVKCARLNTEIEADEERKRQAAEYVNAARIAGLKP